MEPVGQKKPYDSTKLLQIQCPSQVKGFSYYYEIYIYSLQNFQAFKYCCHLLNFLETRTSQRYCTAKNLTFLKLLDTESLFYYDETESKSSWQSLVKSQIIQISWLLNKNNNKLWITSKPLSILKAVSTIKLNPYVFHPLTFLWLDSVFCQIWLFSTWNCQ